MTGPGPVVVVGDVLVDVVIRPGTPVATGSDTPSAITTRQGGAAANAAAWLARLGTAVRLVGRVGDDPAAAAVAAALAAVGVDLHLTRDPVAPTGTVVAVVAADGQDRDMYTDRGAAARLAPADLADGWLDGAGHLHVSGYALLDDVTRPAGLAALAAAATAGVHVSIDVASAAPLRAAGPEQVRSWLPAGCLVKGNADEAAVLTGVADPAAAARALARGLLGEVVVTAGGDGAWWSDGTEVQHVGATPLHGPIDPVGAGDAFTAGLLTARLAGADPAAQLAAGHRAAATAVAGGPAPGG